MNRSKRAIYRLDKVVKKWEKFFINNGNDLANMINCGTKSMGPGPARIKSSKAWLVKDKIIKEFLSGKSKKDLSKKYKCDIKCTLNPILEETGLI